MGVRTEVDEGPGHERPAGRADRPAHDDGPLQADPGGHIHDDAVAPQGPGQLGELVVGRQRGAAVQAGAQAVDGGPQRADGHPGGASRVGQGDAQAAVVGRLDDRVLVRVDGGQAGRRRGGRHERRLGELRRAQVDVRRVQLVGLAGQGLPGLEGREPVGDQPLGIAATRGLDRGGIDGQGQVVQGPPGGPGTCRRGRHPSDPSISIFTSRLNSMAYSIGSSLVKTSRKPWTMRLVASFSVRPRLIR